MLVCFGTGSLSKRRSFDRLPPSGAGFPFAPSVPFSEVLCCATPHAHEKTLDKLRLM